MQYANILNELRVAAPCGGRSGVWVDTKFLSIRSDLRLINRRARKNPNEHTRTRSEGDAAENEPHENTENKFAVSAKRQKNRIH